MTLTEPAAPADPASRATLTSVRNAARVLRAFSRAGQELGITELARQLGLGKSTVHRLVTTLTAERLLERGSTPGRYRLGLVLYELGSNVTEHVDLHQAALPVIATLRHETGEMVHVAVLDGLEVVYVERLESHNLLPVFRQVGHRLPAHWTSSGKILLAALPPDELSRRLADWRPVAQTPWTITDKNRLLAELAAVAERGWAQNQEEGHRGIVSVGAPIRGRDGTVMVTGMFRGLSRQDAARFSFLLSAPVILAAGVLKLPDLTGPLGAGIGGQVLFGSVLSGIGAYLSLHFLTRYFSDPKRTLTPFAIYCLAAGLGCLIYLSVR